ncbi:hypothetical protein [Polaromonas jejuensis]|nr:hypothetical protein [Polaromonas jejuensis]
MTGEESFCTAISPFTLNQQALLRWFSVKVFHNSLSSSASRKLGDATLPE